MAILQRAAKVISDFEVWAAGDIGRRRWTDEDKVRIVEESLAGYRQGSATARRHGISRSLLSRWRADYRAGRLGGGRPTFAAVTLTADAMAAAPEVTIEIVLCSGRRMIVPASIDASLLERLLPVVEGS